MGHVITALEVQNRKSSRVNVHLDGAYAFSLNRIVAAWLTVGNELNDEEIESLKRDDSYEEAANIAMRFIAYKPRTAAELRKRLTEGRLSQQVIEHTIARFTETGLINDEQYARDWVNNRQTFHPRSHRMIAFELRRKGVTQMDIESALAEAGADDQQAYQLAMKKKEKYASLDFLEYKTKLGNHLARHGFSYDVIARVVKRTWLERTEGTKHD